MNPKRIGLLLAACIALPLMAADAKPDLAALVAKVPDADPDGRFTGPSWKDAETVYREILKGGKESVQGLAKMLVEPGAGDDYRVRYTLHGLCIFVGSGDLAAERQVVGDGLMASLEGASPNVGAFLIGELQFLADKRAVPLLARYVTDEKLYEPAIRAMVQLREGSAAPLREALGKARGRNRLSAIQALGTLRDETAVDAILPSLKSSEAEERMAAAAALAAIGSEKAIDGMLELREKAEGHEGAQATDACFRLVSQLQSRNRKDAASKILSAIWQVLAQKNEPHLRHAVIQGIVAGLIDEPTEALIRRMQEANPAERAAILFVFANRKDAAAFDTVAAALKDDDSGVRLLAVSALGPVGAERAVPMLVALLPGDGPEMQQALQLALINLPGAASNDALAKAFGELPAGGNLAARRLILMNVAAQRRTTQAAPEVLKLASDADETVRLRAFETLARIATGEVAPGLVALLARVKEGREQQACTDALIAACGNIGDEQERLKPLLPAVETGEPKQRVQLLGAAGRIGTAEAMALLVKTLGDPNPEIADAAMRALCDFPNDHPWPKLQELAKENPNPKHQVMAFKGCIRLAEQKKNDGERLTMLQVLVPLAQRPEDRMQIFGLLGNIQSKQALKLVSGFLDDEAVRSNAALAAIQISRKLRDKEPAAIKEAMERVLAVVQDAKIRGDAERMLKEVEKK